MQVGRNGAIIMHIDTVTMQFYDKATVEHRRFDWQSAPAEVRKMHTAVIFDCKATDDVITGSRGGMQPHRRAKGIGKGGILQPIEERPVTAGFLDALTGAQGAAEVIAGSRQRLDVVLVSTRLAVERPFLQRLQDLGRRSVLQVSQGSARTSAACGRGRLP